VIRVELLEAFAQIGHVFGIHVDRASASRVSVELLTL
jgi:hypothetical protein